MRDSIILGCASTGAKFTPNNHKPTGDSLIDTICTGGTIKNNPATIVAEAAALYELGCRYYHYHARNPLTREQTTDNEVYRHVSRSIQRQCKDMLLSFGASRNGREVRENIQEHGEWERVSQCAIPLHFGGAHFVTIQAAVELQIMCELERAHGEFDVDRLGSREFRDIVRAYRPSAAVYQPKFETYSTSKGADYGSTSPRIQMQVYKNALRARRSVSLFHEVEWVQLDRSYALTRFAVEHPSLRLGSSKQLNIALLFGFSPRFPFPKSYQEFQNAVRTAKLLEHDIANPGHKQREVTITVGAAVLPQQAEGHYIPVDVGPRKGTPMDALRRLATYAAQPDSDVDVLRVGMEDTPYSVDSSGNIQFADNTQLAIEAVETLAENGVRVETDHHAINDRMMLNRMGANLSFSQRAHPLGDISGDEQDDMGEYELRAAV